MAITDVLPYIGVDEIASDKVGLLKALVAEMMGTLFLVVVGCGSCYANTEPASASYVFHLQGVPSGRGQPFVGTEIRVPL